MCIWLNEFMIFLNGPFQKSFDDMIKMWDGNFRREFLFGKSKKEPFFYFPKKHLKKKYSNSNWPGIVHIHLCKKKKQFHDKSQKVLEEQTNVDQIENSKGKVFLHIPNYSMGMQFKIWIKKLQNNSFFTGHWSRYSLVFTRN